MNLVTPRAVHSVVGSAFESRLVPSIVLETLKKFEGKKITKRFATAVEKALPHGYTVSYRAEKGYRFTIYVWGGPHDGNKIPYDKRYSFDLGVAPWNGPLSSAAPFSVSKFTEEYSARYYKWANERNAARSACLTEEWCEETATALNKVIAARAALAEAVKTAEELAAKSPERYALLALTEEK